MESKFLIVILILAFIVLALTLFGMFYTSKQVNKPEEHNVTIFVKGEIYVNGYVCNCNAISCSYLNKTYLKCNFFDCTCRVLENIKNS